MSKKSGAIQTKPIGWLTLIISAAYFTLSTIYRLLKDKDPTHLQKLRDTFSSHDQRLSAAETPPEHFNRLAELPPHELQKKISAHYALAEIPKRLEFQVKTLESVSINSTPKKSSPPTPPTFKLKKSENKKSHLKVILISDSKALSNKALELPIPSLERMAIEFLSNHNKGKDQSPHKALNYALKQVAIIELTQPPSEPQLVDIITSGNRKLISEHLNKKTDLNEKSANGWTPLMMAVAQGDIETTRTLLDLGADPDIKNLHNRCALHFAARYANLNSCLLLMEYGATLNIQDDLGNTPLIMAASQGSLEVVQALVNAGANIKTANHSNETALNISQKLRYGHIAKILRSEINK